MYYNLASMAEKYGKNHFKFIPSTYVLPAESMRLKDEMEKFPQ
jgi:hypothetical protein